MLGFFFKKNIFEREIKIQIFFGFFFFFFFSYVDRTPFYR